MAYTIRAGIALDGEREFKQAVAGINNELKNLKAETKLVQETFKGEANTLSALEAKHKVLNKTLEQNKQKEQEIAKALQHATQVRDKVKSGLDKLKASYDAEKKKLDEMRSSGKASEKEMAAQEKTVKKYADAVKAGEKNLATAENRIKRWTAQQTNAKLQTAQVNNALKENAKYLQEAGKSADHTAKSIDEFGRSQKNASEDTRTTGDAMQALATAMVSAGVAQKVGEVASALYDCAEASGQFQTGVAKVMTIADKNVTSNEKMSESLLKMSEETGQSVSDLAESTYQAISASVDTADAVQFVGDAAKVAVGGFTDQTTAVDTLTTVINAYGKSASEASHISDVLIETQNKGKTTVNDLGAALGQVIPSAASAGVSFENLSTAMAIVTKNGVNTDIAGTSLKAMFTELSKSGSAVSKTLKSETGQSFSELMNSGMSLGDVLQILLDSCNGNTEAFKNLFGNVRSQTAAYYLASDGAKSFNDELNIMTSTSGQAQAAFETMANSPEYVSRRFETAAENMKIAVGSAIEPALSSLKKTGASAFNWASDFVKENPEVVAAITGVTTALGLMAGGVTALAAAGTIINVLKEALVGLGAVSSIGIPIIGITAAIGGLATASAMISSKNKEAEQADKALGQSIEQTTNQIKANMEERKSSSASYKEKADQIAADQESADNNLIKAKERLKNAQDNLNRSQKEGNAGLGAGQFEKQKKTVEDAEKAYKSAKDQVEALSNEYENNKSAAEENGESIIVASDSAQAYAQAMGEDVGSVNEDAAQSFQNLTDAISSASDGFGEFNGGEKLSADDIISNLKSQEDGIKSWADNMKSLAGRTGAGMTTEFYEYLESLGPQSANIISSIANMSDKQLQQAIDMWSKTYGEGVSKTAAEVEKEKQKIDDATKSNAGKNAGGNKGQGEKAGNAVAEGEKSAKPKTKKATNENDKQTKSHASNNVAHNKSQGKKSGEATSEGVKNSKSKTKKATQENDNATKSNAGKNKAHNQKQAKEATDVSGTIKKNKSKNQNAMDESLKLDVKSEKSKFKKSGSELGESVAKGIKSKKSRVTSAAKALVSGGPTVIRSRRGAFQSAGAYVASGVAVGMRSQIPSIISASNTIVTQAERVMKAKAQIKSPSRRFRDRVGKYIGLGVAQGVKDSGKEVNVASISLISDSMRAAMREAQINSPSKKWRKKVGQQMGNGVALGVSDSAGKGKKSAAKLASDVQKAAEKWLSKEGKKSSKAKSAEYQAYFYERLLKDGKHHGNKYYKSIKKYVEKQEKTLATAQIKAAKSKISKAGTLDTKAINKQIKLWQDQIKAAKKYGKAYQKEIKKQADAEIKTLKELQNDRKEYAVSSGGLDSYKTYFNVSERAEVQYWDKIRKIKGLSASQQLEADRNYNEASKQLEEDRKDAYEDYAEKIKDINDGMKSDIQSLEDAYQSSVKSTTDTIMSSYDLFDTFLSESVTGKELLENMRMQAWGYGEWEKDLETLRNKFSDMNLSNDLLNEIIEKGPKAAAQVKALTQLDPDELLQYSQLYTQKAEIARKEALKQNEALRNDTDKQIDEIKKKADADLKAALDEYNKTIAELEKPMAAGLSVIANNSASWGEETIIKYAQAMAQKASDPSTWTAATKAIQSGVKSATGGSSGGTTTKISTVTKANSPNAQAAKKIINTVANAASKKSSSKKSATSYYKKVSYSGDSLTDAMKRAGINNSFDNRKKIAKANGIKDYSSTSAQNKKLLGLLKKGKLKKAHRKGGIVSEVLPLLAAQGDDGLASVQVGEMILPKKFTADMVPRFTKSVERLTGLLESIPNTGSLNALVNRMPQTVVVNAKNGYDTTKLNTAIDMILEYLPNMEYIPEAARKTPVLMGDAVVGEMIDPIANALAQRVRRSGR